MCRDMAGAARPRRAAAAVSSYMDTLSDEDIKDASEDEWQPEETSAKPERKGIKRKRGSSISVDEAVDKEKSVAKVQPKKILKKDKNSLLSPKKTSEKARKNISKPLLNDSDSNDLSKAKSEGQSFENLSVNVNWDIVHEVSSSVNWDKTAVKNTMKLLDTDNTIPFIARYVQKYTHN